MVPPPMNIREAIDILAYEALLEREGARHVTGFVKRCDQLFESAPIADQFIQSHDRSPSRVSQRRGLSGSDPFNLKHNCCL